MRVKRGTLPSAREGVRLYVLLNIDPTTEPGRPHDRDNDRTSELIATLRDQLEAERQAHAEARRIIAGLVERIPAIEAPRDERESPQTVEEEPPDRGRAPAGYWRGSGGRTAPVVEESVRRVKPETALFIAVSAAVVGQILGGLLTLFGGWVNDYFASKRMVRQQRYEDHKREEQQKREDQLRLRSEWSRACKDFMAATTITQPLQESARQEHHRTLNEAYVETRLYGSGMRINAARGLYRTASEAIDTEEEDAAVWEHLQQHRDDFLERARDQHDQE